MNDLIAILEAIGKMLLMLSPFLILSILNAAANLPREIRFKQFLMPFAAVIITLVAMFFLTDIYDAALDLLKYVITLLDRAVICLRHQSSLTPGSFAQWSHDSAKELANFIREQNLPYWAFYVANGLMLLVYVILKKICLAFMKGLFKEGSFFQKLAGEFYEYDETTGLWHLIPKFGQGRTFLKTLYIAAIVIGTCGILGSSRFYLTGELTAPFYPVFCVIILGEVWFFLHGLTRKEYHKQIDHEVEESNTLRNYSIMRRVLRQLFPDKLSAENTTVSDGPSDPVSTDEVLAAAEESERVAEEAYGRFMRIQCDKGLKLDRNYFMSGRQLLRGESVLFNNPFYYDLIPYVSFPMNRTLLRHKKVLIILGRHGAEVSAEKWCREGLTAINNIPSLWNIGVLTEEQQDLDVGIITRSSVHDLKLHEANREFFDQVEFVMIMEPSRLVTTAQVGLNSIVRHCRRKKKQLVFCSTDKNCDGLVDALSHILMTSLEEVSATDHHSGASSYMIWDADGEYLQHRLLPNLSRYLGIGTEMSFAALKNQVPVTQWYGGEAFPVVDTHWISRQYYYDLLRYANLPTTQETLEKVFRVSPDMWEAEAADNQYITVEDESFNMFEVKREFSTRAKDQGFVNVICSDYLLKDYMAANDSIFNADPKAIPYITADYARTARNVVLRLCLRLSTGTVPEREIRKELLLIDRDSSDPVASLWETLCMTCGHVGSVTRGFDGRLTIHCWDGEDIAFSSGLILRKRRFDMETGGMETMYTITDRRFIRLVLDPLKPAEYIAEDENGQHQYLGSELLGHIFQKYLPGQFFTLSGKYYEMLRVTSDGKVIVRRASDHIEGRPSYRQVRNYYITAPVDSTTMGECRDMGPIRITRQFADIRVETPAYWSMKRHNDFATGRRVNINGIPSRVYNNKSIIRVDLDPQGELDSKTVSTLALLMNEVLRTLLAENQDYLAVVSGGEALEPATYSLFGEGGFQPSDRSIYLIEDSQMDIGLLDAVERNLNRIFAIICDYLHWHDEAMELSMNPPQTPDRPAPVFTAPTEQTQTDAPAKKKGLIGRIVDAIRDFFKKLFGGKKKSDPAAPTAEEPMPVPAGEDVPQDIPAEEAAPVEEITPAEEIADAPMEEAAEEAAEEPVAEDASNTSFRLFDQTPGEEIPAEETPAEIPAEETADSGDTMEYEPEQTAKPSPVSNFVRKPYHERYYLHYCRADLEANLDISGVRDLLDALGYAGSALTQARKGKDVAQMVERSFVPNQAGSHYCDFCGSLLSGLDYDILADGRERCSACGRTAVKSLDEFTALHDSVMRNMKVFFGIRINAPVHIRMVNSKRLHKMLGQTFVPTGNADGRILGVAIKDRKGYTILIENGAPRLQSTMTMVHEMTHIWQYLNWNAKNIQATYGDARNLAVYEGMAKWVEIQYTYLLGETAAAKREEIITRCRQDEYGEGFRMYVEKYPLSIGTANTGATPFENLKQPL